MPNVRLLLGQSLKELRYAASASEQLAVDAVGMSHTVWSQLRLGVVTRNAPRIFRRRCHDRFTLGSESRIAGRERAFLSTPETILNFWFGDEPKDYQALLVNLKRWGPDLDKELSDRFGKLIEQACAGQLDAWTGTQSGTRALVLLLDQFPRHAYRGSARQYAGDERALEVALAAWREAWPSSLPFWARVYMLLPFAHSEVLEHQLRQRELAEALSRSAPAWFGEVANIPVSQAAKYLDVIQTFGRFPHRNQLLGRESTAAELEWLAAGGAERMPPGFLRKRS